MREKREMEVRISKSRTSPGRDKHSIAAKLLRLEKNFGGRGCFRNKRICERQRFEAGLLIKCFCDVRSFSASERASGVNKLTARFHGNGCMSKQAQLKFGQFANVVWCC